MINKAGLGMKKQVIYFLFAFTSLLNAQWVWQNPYPTNDALTSVKFINANTGWAVGGFGTVLDNRHGS